MKRSPLLSRAYLTGEIWTLCIGLEYSKDSELIDLLEVDCHRSEAEPPLRLSELDGAVWTAALSAVATERSALSGDLARKIVDAASVDAGKEIPVDAQRIFIADVTAWIDQMRLVTAAANA